MYRWPSCSGSSFVAQLALVGRNPHGNFHHFYWVSHCKPLGSVMLFGAKGRIVSMTVKCGRMAIPLGAYPVRAGNLIRVAPIVQPAHNASACLAVEPSLSHGTKRKRKGKVNIYTETTTVYRAKCSVCRATSPIALTPCRAEEAALERKWKAIGDHHTLCPECYQFYRRGEMLWVGSYFLKRVASLSA